MYDKSLSYNLRETEFITLFGSYCNILKRIYKQIEEPKNHIDFIKALIELSLNQRSEQDKKYETALRKSAQFERIADFYRAIYQDSNLKIRDKFNKKEVYAEFKNKKFDKLVKWTLRAFEEELKNEI